MKRATWFAGRAPSVKFSKHILKKKKKMLCGFLLPLWGTTLILLSYTYSAASTKRWSSDIHTVHSWGSHTHRQTHTHTVKYVGVWSSSDSRKRVYHNLKRMSGIRGKQRRHHTSKMAFTLKRCNVFCLFKASVGRMPYIFRLAYLKKEDTSPKSLTLLVTSGPPQEARNKLAKSPVIVLEKDRKRAD